MAISLIATPGGLFTRLGKIGAVINNVNRMRGAGIIGANFDEIRAQYNSSLQQLTDGLYGQRDSHRGSYASVLSAMKSLAEKTVIEMAHADAVLVTKDLPTALRELIAQMTANTQTVDANTVTGTAAAAAGNTGDSTVVVSVKNGKGKTLELAFAEVIEVIATNDSQASISNLGSEAYSVKGEVAVSDSMDFSFPGASGGSASLTAVDPVIDARAAGNLLTNSDFDVFAAGIADSWVTAVGSTTSISDGTSGAYKGQHCLKILGDGAELTQLTQEFDSEDGTAGVLLPNTVYHIHLKHKVNAVPAAGVLVIDLFNATGSAVMNDDAGAANSITQALTASTTSFTSISGSFRTPAVLPASVKIRIRLSTALTATNFVLIDQVTMAKAVQAYIGGPYLSQHSGATPALIGDKYLVTISNDWAGAMQLLFERLFGMRAKGLLLPSHTGGSETVNDSLLTSGNASSSTCVVTAPGTADADGIDTVAIVVTVKDAFGAPVVGKTITLAGTGTAVVVEASDTTDAAGLATFTATNDAAETVTFTATVVEDGVTIGPSGNAVYA